MSAHAFCRVLLREVMLDVRPLTTVTERKDAWAYCYDDLGDVEFHGPSEFYWSGEGCCKWSARSQGWEAWLEKQEDRHGS